MKRFVLFSIGLAMLLTAACSSPETPQPQEEQTLPVSSFFGPQPRPAGVDPALWRQLVSEFDRVLLAQGTARRVSVPPTGSGSEVGDLWVTPDGGGGADMSWSYRNQGDLNLDGTVSIADLTPIGVHYLNSSTAGDWIEHQIADADANGVVSITDLTPIGINYGGKVAGYEIQMRFLSATEWTHASWVPFIASMPGSTQPPRYSFHLAAPLPNLVYRVVPTANADEPYQYGVASNGVLYSLASVPFWNQQQGGDARNGQSKVAGPLSETVAWTLELAGTAAHVTSPVADAYGSTYTSLAAPNPGMMQPGPGTLYAVNRFGQLEWSYRSGKSLSPPLLSVDENVYVQEDGGSILCFTRDGHLRWKRDFIETSHGAWWQPVIADNGLLITPDAEDRLNAIEPDGSLRWSVALAAAPAAAPTIFNPVVVLPLEDQTIGGNTLTDGMAMTAFAFDSRWPVVYDDSANLLFTGSSFNSIGILPVVFPIYQSFLPAQGNIQAPPIVVSNENYVVCSVTSTGASSYTSRMYGFNGDGTELWDRGLFAGVFAPMLVDPLGNIYLSALTEGADAGVYCVDDGHNIVWHYSTPGMVPGAPCPAYTNLLVLHVRADSPDAATTTLTAIGVVEPEGSV